jgi:hypothetical protein
MSFKDYSLIRLVEILNNREKAILVWLVVFFIFVLFQKSVRKTILDLLKFMFLSKISIIFMGSLIYSGLIVFLLYEIRFWNFLMVKDTVYWIFGTSFVLLMNSNKENTSSYLRVILDCLKVTIILEFIINLYSFNFWVELFLFITLLFLVFILNASTEVDTAKYNSIKKITDWILIAIGIYLFIFAFLQVLCNPKSLITIDNLRVFLLPFVLTLLYIPFLFIFTLFMAYENLFVKINFYYEGKKALMKYIQFKVFLLCFLNLNKLNRFTKNNSAQLIRLNNKTDVVKLIEQFHKT